jgi:predicted O-methyltransferase YrrM
MLNSVKHLPPRSMGPQTRSHAKIVQTAKLKNAPVYLVGPRSGDFAVEAAGDRLEIRPKQPLACRHTIRPVAIFENSRGYPNLNSIMGRMVFPNGSSEPLPYRPFTRDPKRSLKALFLPIETMPDDDWNTSSVRWQNCEALAEHLVESAGMTWNGLTDKDVQALVDFVDWADPYEGCLLHAMVQWTHECGCSVIEVGSYRGRSASTISLALAGVASESPLISVDPHIDQPFNRQHMHVALRQIGQEERLVQIIRGSDDAARLLRDGCASFIFIDGDHSYEQVVRDFQNYRGLLAPGGIIAFHDYGYGDHNGHEDHCPGVRRAVDEFVLSDLSFKPLLLVDTLFAFKSLSR